MEGQVAEFMGYRKVGKSYFLTQLLISVALGEDWGGGKIRVPEARKVLYVQTEGARQDVAERVVPVARLLEPGVELQGLFIPTMGLGLDLKTGKELEPLKEKIVETGAEIVAFDSFYSSTSGSFNTDSDVAAVSRSVQELRSEFPALAMILVHHEHRPRRDQQTGGYVDEGAEATAGSWVLGAMVDCMWRLKKAGNQHGSRRIFSLEFARSRFQEMESFEVGMDSLTGVLVPDPVDGANRKGAMCLWVKSLGRVSAGALKDWCRDQDVPDSTRNKWLRDLLAEGWFKKREEKGDVFYDWVKDMGQVEGTDDGEDEGEDGDDL